MVWDKGLLGGQQSVKVPGKQTAGSQQIAWVAIKLRVANESLVIRDNPPNWACPLSSPALKRKKGDELPFRFKNSNLDIIPHGSSRLHKLSRKTRVRELAVRLLQLTPDLNVPRIQIAARNEINLESGQRRTGPFGRAEVF